MAVLNLPVGYNSIPVFEDRPTVDPTINTACRMIPTQITNDMFQLVVRDLERCGVQRCRQPNGEVSWLRRCFRESYFVGIFTNLCCCETELLFVRLILEDFERCIPAQSVQTLYVYSPLQTWLCLNLRFPLVNGLKLPEDEIIQIKCRPQDKMAQDTHVLTVATAMYAAKGAM